MKKILEFNVKKILIGLLFIAILGLMNLNRNHVENIENIFYPEYFKILIEDTPILDEKQLEIYNEILNNRATNSSLIVRYKPEFATKEHLTVQLDKETFIFVRQLEAAVPAQGLNKIVWANTGSNSIITLNGKNARGLIYYRNKVFSLQPLGDGLHVICEINQGQFGED